MKPIIKESEINEIQQLILCHEQGDDLIRYAFVKCEGIENRNTKNLGYNDYLSVSKLADYMTIYDTISVLTKVGKSWKDIVKAFEFIGYCVVKNLSNGKE